MKFLKSRSGAAAVLVIVVIFSTLFGSHRSLAAEAGKVTAQNQNVMKDLENRAAVGANLYTVGLRYLTESDPAMQVLKGGLDSLEKDVTSLVGQGDVLLAAPQVAATLLGLALSDQDAKYAQGFQAQLEAINFTISHDAYTAQAQAFNEETLSAFPANVLGNLTGVRPLPVYH